MFAEDLLPFFSPAELATTATLDGVAVAGIFDHGYAPSFDGGVATQTPTFLLSSAAAASATPASLLVVGGVSHRVRSIEPDGTGLTQLVLARG